MSRVPITLLATLVAASLGQAFTLGSYVFAQSTSGGSTDQTNTPGQLLQVTDGRAYGKALPDFGLTKAYATVTPGTGGNGDMVSDSEWVLYFTLSQAANLAISYSWDYSINYLPPIGEPNSGTSASFQLDTQNNFKAVFASDQTGPQFGQDLCPDRPNNTGLPGFCSGGHSDAGTLILPFDQGLNRIDAILNVHAYGGGTADAFNTGKLTQIVVPDGVTFTYDPSVSGNPLNVVHASDVAAPEPQTLGFLLSGLAAFGFRRGLRYFRTTGR